MDKRKPKTQTIIIDNLGRVQPQDTTTERYILGAILLAYKNIDCQKILQSAKPEHFWLEQHRIVYTAIQELWGTDSPIDILTVTDQLRHSGELEQVGGPIFVAELTNGIGNTGHLLYWFYHIVYPLYLRRKIIEVSARSMQVAYDDTVEIFDELDQLIEELSQCKPDVLFKPSHTANSVGEDFIQSMGLTEEETEEPVIQVKKYLTRHKKFNDIVGICGNKIITLAGHKASLKSRFSNELVTSLMEDYPDEVACYWVSLEDSAEEQLRIYLSRKVLIRPELIKFGTFDKLFRPTLHKWVKKFQSFDCKIRDSSVKIRDIGVAFKQFCAERPDKLCILIIDNVLSLADREDYKRDPNQMYDDIGAEILNIKRSTHGLILPIHHFNDEASAKSELPNGYRPRIVNMKGTEVWRRISFQTILINYPRYYKDLVAQYSGDQKTILENILILDVATNRAHREDDSETLLRYFVEPDYDLFYEIDDEFEAPIPEYVPPIKHDSEEPF